MDARERIEHLTRPALEAMGFELVRVQISGSRRKQLQIMAEPADGRSMTVDDCAEISRTLSALFDVEDPIAEAYTLEVSSPGIDRPLTRLKDFETYKGFEAKLETRMPISGRRRWRGTLLGVADPDGAEPKIRLALETEQTELPFAEVSKAKLVLTDALIAAHHDDAAPPGA